VAYYLAHIGTFSRPAGVYPAGGQAGEKLTAHIVGDPSGPRTEQIALPKQTGDFEYFGQGAPTPNVLRISNYPNVLREDAEHPTRVPSLPAALNGIIGKKGQVDTFQFAAKKGESWKLRVYARTLGSPMDPKIWIRSVDNPKHLMDADDSKLADLGLVSSRGSWYTKDTLDPVAVFKPAADGEYLLNVEDTRGTGSPEHIYRVEMEPVVDTVYTHITMPEAYQAPRVVGMIVPQGNRWTLDVQLAQGIGNSYKGDIELEAAGLPKGVTMIAPRYTKGLTKLPVQFVAAPDAEQQAVLVELRARPVDKTAKLATGSRQAFAQINRPGELPWHFVFLNRYALAVTQPAPFHIELEQPEIPLAQNGELSLKVKVIRHGDFQGPVEIQTDWLPANVSKEPAITIPAGKDEGMFKIHADAKAASGTYKIAMNATTTGGDAYTGIGRIRVSSAFVDLKISEPYLSVELKRASVERGQKGQIVGQLKQNNRSPVKPRWSWSIFPRASRWWGRRRGSPPRTRRSSSISRRMRMR
jgi:hypothetical protein